MCATDKDKRTLIWNVWESHKDMIFLGVTCRMYALFVDREVIKLIQQYEGGKKKKRNSRCLFTGGSFCLIFAKTIWELCLWTVFWGCWMSLLVGDDWFLAILLCDKKFAGLQFLFSGSQQYWKICYLCNVEPEQVIIYLHELKKGTDHLEQS